MYSIRRTITEQNIVQILLNVTETLIIGAFMDKSDCIHLICTRFCSIHFIFSIVLVFFSSLSAGCLALLHSFRVCVSTFRWTYNNKVMVTDNGIPQLSSTTRVVITVDDINDHSPEFDQKFYKVQIPSNARVDQPLFQVRRLFNVVILIRLQPCHILGRFAAKQICLAPNRIYNIRNDNTGGVQLVNVGLESSFGRRKMAFGVGIWWSSANVLEKCTVDWISLLRIPYYIRLTKQTSKYRHFHLRVLIFFSSSKSQS